MFTPELIDYIKQARAAGQTDAQIKSALLQIGWTEGDINAGFNPPETFVVNYGESSSGETQSQGENMEYAGFWIRTAAAIIDAFIVMGAVALFVGAIIAGGIIFGMLGWNATFGIIFTTVMTLLLIVGIPTYFIWMTKKYGATFGKKAMRIKVVSENSVELSWGKVILREIVGKWVSGFLLNVGYLLIAFDSRKQGLHDKIAKTLVVYRDSRNKVSQNTIIWIVTGGFILILIGGMAWGFAQSMIDNKIKTLEERKKINSSSETQTLEKDKSERDAELLCAGIYAMAGIGSKNDNQLSAEDNFKSELKKLNISEDEFVREWSNLETRLGNDPIYDEKVKKMTMDKCPELGIGTVSEMQIHEANLRENLKSSDYPKALEEFDWLIKDGNNQYYYEQRGELYYNTGEYDKALDDFKKCSEVYYPSSEDHKKDSGYIYYRCFNDQAVTYYKLGDINSALALFDQINKIMEDISAKNLSPYGYKGGIYFRLGMYDEAETEHKKIIQKRKEWNLITDDGHDLISIGNCKVKEGSTSEALDFYNQAIQLREPKKNIYTDMSVYYYLGDYYLYTGDIEKARENYKIAASADQYRPSYGKENIKEASLALVALSAHEGKYEEAWKTLNNIDSKDIETNPSHNNIDYLKLKIYLSEKRGNESDRKQTEDKLQQLEKHRSSSYQLNQDSQNLIGIPLLFKSIEEKIGE